MPKPALARMGLFLLLLFGISWGLFALERAPFWPVDTAQADLLPVGMLMPALIALLMGLSLDSEDRMHASKLETGPRQVVIGYFMLTIVVAALNLLGRTGILHTNLIPSLGNLAFVLWTLLLIRQLGQTEPGAFRRCGLQLGHPEKGIPIAAGVVLFFLVQALLNLAFGLGNWRGVQDQIAGIPVPGALYPFLLAAFFGLTVVGSPLGNMVLLFGEEYAWRGYLLRELAPLGRRRSTLLIGLIWGTWHIPILLSGVHTYPPTELGFALALLFFTLWSFVQSYVVYKVGSVWAAAFLHGIVNGVYAFMLTYLVYPHDKLFSFGLGVYGLAMLAVIVLTILRDPVWLLPFDDAAPDHVETA